MKSKTTGLFPKILLTLNVFSALMLLVSAYGGFIDPHHFSWLVSGTLAFPFLVFINILFLLMWLAVCSRKWLLSFLTLLVCACQLRTSCPINISQPVPKGSIKVLSYNVYAFSGFPIDTVMYAQMLDFLKTLDANILCAQETYYPELRRKDIEGAIAHWKYSDTLLLGNATNGLLMCSDYPIIDRHIIGSPSPSHGCAVYRVKMDNDTVVVVNCHFVSNGMNAEDKRAYRDIILSPEEKKMKDDFLRLCRKVNEAGVKRAVQVDSLIDYLDSLGDVPIIVCGDFNDSPLSYVHHRLTRKLDDAYVASGNGPGISYHLSGMFFRLDNVLCSHHWRSFDAKVMSKYKMSDHYPLEVCLKRIN